MSQSYIDPDNRKICLRVFQLKKSGFLNNLNVQVKVEPKKYSPNNTSIDPPKICGKFFPPEAEADCRLINGQDTQSGSAPVKRCKAALHLVQGCIAPGARLLCTGCNASIYRLMGGLPLSMS